MKLLITSVGSYLGQNVLDCVETRRNMINVVGTNSTTENGRIYRCDKVYLVPDTTENTFGEEFQNIIDKEQPDFILPGVENDCIFLSELKQKNQDKYANIIPFGPPEIPKMMLDKYDSHLFCKENNLPFADTFFYQGEASNSELKRFIDKYGYPLIAKPRKGAGSLGVYYVINNDQLENIIKDNEVLIQEFLGDPQHILQYKNHFDNGIPLFFQLPELEHYSVQATLSPDGKLSEVFFSINNMVHGWPVNIRRLHDEGINQLIMKYSEVMYEHGWYGPLNLQLKQDRNGIWKVFELSPRLTGSSSARLVLGYDEFGILASIFAPQFNIPNLTNNENQNAQVIRYNMDHLVPDEYVQLLNNTGVWTKS